MLIRLGRRSCAARLLVPIATCLGLALAAPTFAQGVAVLAGGGPETDVGDTGGWSYRLYGKLIENGDRNGDGVVTVAILTTQIGTDAWLPNYFQWIGNTQGTPVVAFNVEVPTRADADDAGRVGVVAGADVVFIKGGDQGEYYDLWNGSLLETHVRTVVQTRGGAVGGTSAGAMSQAGYCFCGGNDLISADVLENARTTFLDDASAPGTSGIHDDFLGFVPQVVVDTHYTQRGRMGRLIGILGRAIDDTGLHGLLGIGIDQQSGIVIRNGVAEVIGTGEVSFIQEQPASVLRRDSGHPLYYTDLRLDRLTDGWRFDLGLRRPLTDNLPAGVVAVSYPGPGAPNAGALSIDGAVESQGGRFEWWPTYAPDDYGLTPGSGTPSIRGAIGYTRAGTTSNRAAKQETLFRALYDVPSAIGALVYSGGSLSRTDTDPNRIRFGGTLASIVIDAQASEFKGLAPVASNYGSSGGSLRAAALTNLRVHIIGESDLPNRGASYDTRLHSVIGGPAAASIFANGFD